MRRGLWLPGAVLGVAAVTALGVVTASRQPATPTPRSTSSIAEQQGHHGVNTFTNYHNASGLGQRVDPGAWVQVSCKVYDPTIGSTNPDGYWYRIASAPWNDQYYAPANTFMNGDPSNGPYTHNTDFAVPDCGSAPQPPAPTPSVSLAQGPAAPHGNWYAITLGHFAGNASVSVTCYDTASPGGFKTFSLATNASGSASDSMWCYSGDGPDHWVKANGVESNHVSWGSGSAPAPAPNPVPAPNPASGHTVINGVDVGVAQNQPHAWGACTVQDFKQGPSGWVIVSFTGGTHIVRNGMLWGWFDNGGAPGLGCPVNDEHPVGGQVQQNFTGGSLYWTSGMDHAKRLKLGYYAVGDSYSSGEGNPPFIASAGQCDLTNAAWPYLVGQRDAGLSWVGSSACSGALTTDIPIELTNLIGVTQKVQVVTVTIGGNDAQFSGVLTVCYTEHLRHRNCVSDGTLAGTSTRIAQLGPQLIKTYKLIQAAAPNARLFVVGYPRLFPNSQSQTTGCGWLSNDMRNDLNILGQELNLKVQQSAAAVGATYISVDDVMNGHELCTANSWFNKIETNPFDRRSAHPLAPGQDAIAKAVVQRLQQLGV